MIASASEAMAMRCFTNNGIINIWIINKR